MKIYIRASRGGKPYVKATSNVGSYDDILTMIYEYSRIPKDRWNRPNRYMDIFKMIRSSYYAGNFTIREYQDLMNRLQEVDQ